MKHTVTIVMALVLLLLLYGLNVDLSMGLSLTRSARSTALAVIGLVLLGLGAVLVEGSVECVFGARERGRPYPRRVLRGCAAVFIAVAIVGLALLFGPAFVDPAR